MLLLGFSFAILGLIFAISWIIVSLVSTCCCSNLHTMTYSEFRSKYCKDDYGAREIPKIIFRTASFHLCRAPFIIKYHLENTLLNNPGYIQVYFDDQDCVEFIKEYYPEYLADYDVLIPTAFKADLWRLLVMHKYGGIYNDIGHIYLQPISLLVDNTDELVLTIDHNKAPNSEFEFIPHSSTLLHNAFFASYRKHNVIKLLIEYIIRNIRERKYGDSPLDITGPNAWGKFFENHFGLSEKATKGMYSYNGHRVKLVNYYVYRFKDLRNYIADLNGIPVIQTKFKDYYDIIYTHQNLSHYDILWRKRLVYKR